MRNYQILIENKLEYFLVMQQIRNKGFYDIYDIRHLSSLGIPLDWRKLYFLSEGKADKKHLLQEIEQFKNDCDHYPSLTKHRIRKEKDLEGKIWGRRIKIKLIRKIQCLKNIRS